MKKMNVYDIKNEKELLYILDEDTCCDGNDKQEIINEVAIIMYLYYLEELERLYIYMESLSCCSNIYVISSREEVLKKAKEFFLGKKIANCFYILKENRGRDISALLVTAKDLVLKYKYVCFLHDKKEKTEAAKEDVELWIENLWGNLIKSENYICKVLDLFEKNQNIGVLAPPDPVGKYFFTWYGYGWHGSFNITKKLCEKLNLDTELDERKPPITIGTTLWFRTEALRKLFEYPWKYEDFNDEELVNTDYLSYGIERIFAYVAQDAGFDTAEIMTISYAKKQTLVLKKNIVDIFSVMQEYFPFPATESAIRVNKNVEELIKYAKKNKNIYLYGCGTLGKFCLTCLRKEGIEPLGFIVSSKCEIDRIDSLPVYPLEAVKLKKSDSVVITPGKENIQKEIINCLLSISDISTYIFWK